MFQFPMPPFKNVGVVASTEDLKLSIPKFVSERHVSEVSRFVTKHCSVSFLVLFLFWLSRGVSLVSMDTKSGDSLPRRNGVLLI